MISACRSEWNSHSFLCVRNLWAWRSTSKQKVKTTEQALGQENWPRWTSNANKQSSRDQQDWSKYLAAEWLPRVLWSRHLLHHKQVQASKDVHFRKFCWKSCLSIGANITLCQYNMCMTKLGTLCHYGNTWQVWPNTVSLCDTMWHHETLCDTM